MRSVTDPERTLALLRSECETCGAWGVFTGRTQRSGGLTFAVVRCPDEGIDFTVWSERGAEVLEAYERARGRSRPDLDVLPVLTARLAGLRRPPEPTAEAVRQLLGAALTEHLLGATEVRVEGGWLPTVELVFGTGPGLTRADLDALCGVGRLLPRTGPHAPHVVAHDVPAAEGPSHVVVFARFGEVPGPEAAVRSLLLRVDLP
jgi:hypothetical protein